VEKEWGEREQENAQAGSCFLFDIPVDQLVSKDQNLQRPRNQRQDQGDGKPRREKRHDGQGEDQKTRRQSKMGLGRRSD
jgi:hypothetical protein